MEVLSMRSCSLPRALALAALVLAANWGCASKSDRPETLPVRGKVTYKGQPVTKGTITFQPDAGETATGQIQPDGTYTLSTFGEQDGALAGHHKVMIIANDADPTLMPGSSPGYKPPKDLVPKKYAKLETSGLVADVAKDKTTFDFELK
jgi:hypothetical protein